MLDLWEVDMTGTTNTAMEAEILDKSTSPIPNGRDRSMSIVSTISKNDWRG